MNFVLRGTLVAIWLGASAAPALSDVTDICSVDGIMAVTKSVGQSPDGIEQAKQYFIGLYGGPQAQSNIPGGITMSWRMKTPKHPTLVVTLKKGEAGFLDVGCSEK